MRRASRTDGNHRELFDAARQLGAVVIETHTVGRGCPDGFVWALGCGWLAVEVKTKTGRFQPGQLALQLLAPITVWRCYDDVVASLVRKRKR